MLLQIAQCYVREDLSALTGGQFRSRKFNFFEVVSESQIGRVKLLWIESEECIFLHGGVRDSKTVVEYLLAWGIIHTWMVFQCFRTKTL